MKVLHTEASDGWGGQEMRILTEAEAMREKGFGVIFCVQHNGKLGLKAKKRGFEVYYTSFCKRYWWKTFFFLLKLIRDKEIDLINTHSSLDAWIAGIAGRMSGIKIVRTRHLSAFIRGGVNAYIVYNYLTDYVVTTCKAIIPEIIEKSKKSPHLCQSIPTGVNLSTIRIDPDRSNEFRRQLDVKEGDFLVGMVCFMRSWKGVDDFIEAARLSKGIKGLKWVLIGGGHVQDYLPRIKNMKIEDSLKLTDHINSPFSEIAALDAFSLLSTKNEGVSQASLQAAFLKKPLITTRAGGLPEVCIDQKTGFIVDYKSPQDVLEKVLKLKNDVNLRKKLGENAHKLVLENFTFDQTIEKMIKVYTRCT